MINGNLNVFLDTGWYSESTLFYHDRIYWCEGYATDDNFTEFEFTVFSWRAVLDDAMHYRSVTDDSNHLLDYRLVYKINGSSMDQLKEQFLLAPVFDGRTFMEAEKDLAWAEGD